MDNGGNFAWRTAELHVAVGCLCPVNLKMAVANGRDIVDIAKVEADARAKSKAYFEGNYWLELWGFLWGAAVFVLRNHGQPAQLALQYFDNRPESLGPSSVQIVAKPGD